MIVLLFGDHFEQFLACELVAGIGALEQVGGELSLGLVQADDFLFDGVFADQVIDGDGLGLSDAVGAVGGLLLYGWIPPRVEVEDVVGACQVES